MSETLAQFIHSFIRLFVTNGEYVKVFCHRVRVCSDTSFKFTYISLAIAPSAFHCYYNRCRCVCFFFSLSLLHHFSLNTFQLAVLWAIVRAAASVFLNITIIISLELNVSTWSRSWHNDTNNFKYSTRASNEMVKFHYTRSYTHSQWILWTIRQN